MTSTIGDSSAEREHRSVSQYNTYQRCPYAYKLQRLDKVWQRPAAWLAQGSAVHEAAEAWELSLREMDVEDAKDVFRSSYADHINAAAEITPNFGEWFGSGPYAGETDIERRYHIGLQHIERYIDYYERTPQEVIYLDPSTGVLSVELGFDIDLDGVLIRGYIDAIIQCGSDIIVRDLKTGNKPGDEFQLAVYAVGVEEMIGLKPNRLDYFMSKTGKPTKNYDVGDWGKERITEMFGELEDNIKAERFDPKPDPKTCMFCDVRSSCEFSAIP